MIRYALGFQRSPVSWHSGFNGRIDVSLEAIIGDAADCDITPSHERLSLRAMRAARV